MEFDKLKVAGTIIFAGVAQLLLAVIIAETLYPGYSTFANFISDLGIGPSAYLFNASIILLGVAFILGAYLIYSELKLRLFTILLALCGIGTVGVGIFTEDLLIAHGIASTIAFVFGGLASIASYRLIHSPLKYGSVILGLFGLSALVTAMTGNTLGIGVGGIERMIVYPLLIWGLGFGGTIANAS
jgi:hypothetical membrane protein